MRRRKLPSNRKLPTRSLDAPGIITCRGDKLHPDDRSHVLLAYVYRNTIENNSRRHLAGGKLVPITDQRWLEITDFAVRKDGRLDHRVHECHVNHNEVPEWKRDIDAWAKGVL